ncbi:hypothetical protein WG66_003464 [Moniliophthora roreri]|nr:hypothetical protein WG66_003464 [Moniliophthora roreri]
MIHTSSFRCNIAMHFIQMIFPFLWRYRNTIPPHLNFEKSFGSRKAARRCLTSNSTHRQ